MRVTKLRLAALALVSGVALGGCAYGDMYGGYGGYPYSGVSVGVGYGGGYGGYGYSPYYSGYGYGGGYGSPFGWYDDFYYPGSGIYVYDSYRRPRVWSDRQRRYWTQHRGNWNHHNDGTWHGHDGGTWSNGSNQNWSGFGHRDHANGITIRGSKYYDERNHR